MFKSFSQCHSANPVYKQRFRTSSFFIISLTKISIQLSFSKIKYKMRYSIKFELELTHCSVAITIGYIFRTKKNSFFLVTIVPFPYANGIEHNSQFNFLVHKRRSLTLLIVTHTGSK